MARKNQAPRKPKRDIYQEITDRILGLLDRGVVPWRNPLRRQGGGGWPRNLDTLKRYRGINVFLLAMTSWERGFGSDYWLTFRQAKKIGGQIKKGEKASLVTFWKLYEKTDRESGEEFILPVLRHYNVFNAEQCDGVETTDLLPPDPKTPPFVPLDACEAIVRGYRNGPVIEHQNGPARYRPSKDKVLIPKPEEFAEREDFYSVLFHEMVHSTGISKRLARGLDQESPPPFGSPDYSKEELVAEMGSAFLSAVGGISPPTIEQSAAYIENWKKQLKGDNRMVVAAGGAGQKAADWILGDEFSKAKEPSEERTAPSPNPFPPIAQTGVSTSPPL